MGTEWGGTTTAYSNKWTNVLLFGVLAILLITSFLYGQSKLERVSTDGTQKGCDPSTQVCDRP